MAYQLIRHAAPTARALGIGLPEGLPAKYGKRREAEEEKWPLALRVLFIVASTATLWALIVAGLLWLIG